MHTLEVRSEDGPCYPLLGPLTDVCPLWLLGTGEYKIGANYAPGVLPQKQAGKQGYVQNLWLSGPEHSLTEVRIPLSPSIPSVFFGCL